MNASASDGLMPANVSEKDRNGLRGAPRAAPDGREQAESRDELGERLRSTGTDVMRRKEERVSEHHIRDRNAGESTDDLRTDIAGTAFHGMPPYQASASVTTGLR